MKNLLIALFLTLGTTAIANSLDYRANNGCTIWCKDSNGYEQKGKGEGENEYEAEINAKKLCSAKMYTNRGTSPIRYYNVKCWEIYKY